MLDQEALGISHPERLMSTQDHTSYLANQHFGLSFASPSPGLVQKPPTRLSCLSAWALQPILNAAAKTSLLKRLSSRQLSAPNLHQFLSE